MLTGFLTAFALNLLAEIGDKTQLAAILLSTRFDDRRSVFFGISLAFSTVTLLAVLAGSAVAALVPQALLNMAAGVGFLAFGAFSLHESGKGEMPKASAKGAVASSFALIFIMEIGDKTQMVNLLLSTQFPLLGVYLGAVLALSALGFLAVWFGDAISRRVRPALMHRAAAVLFFVMGMLLLLGWV